MLFRDTNLHHCTSASQGIGTPVLRPSLWRCPSLQVLSLTPVVRTEGGKQLPITYYSNDLLVIDIQGQVVRVIRLSPLFVPIMVRSVLDAACAIPAKPVRFRLAPHANTYDGWCLATVAEVKAHWEAARVALRKRTRPTVCLEHGSVTHHGPRWTGFAQQHSCDAFMQISCHPGIDFGNAVCRREWHKATAVVRYMEFFANLTHVDLPHVNSLAFDAESSIIYVNAIQVCVGSGRWRCAACSWTWGRVPSVFGGETCLHDT